MWVELKELQKPIKIFKESINIFKPSNISQPRPIEQYHFQANLIGWDGPFKTSYIFDYCLLLCKIKEVNTFKI